MPEYTKQETLQRVEQLADDYQNAVGMIDTQNDYFSDISTAIQSKTGQTTPYDKSEMADAIDSIETGLPTDPDSETPLEFGIDENGFYFSTVSGEGTDVSLGRDANGLYAIGDVS